MGKDVSTIDQLSLPAGDYVLVLPGWYPTWLDPMPGDFNQRHVKAAGLYTPQVVLYIGKDNSGTLTQTEVRYHQLTEQVIEIIVVYPQDKVKAWDMIQSHTTYIRLLYKYAEIIKQKWGKPKLLHSYIVIRGGLGGWLLGMHWKRPFVLTENWTIYYPTDPGYLKKRNIVFRTLVRMIFSKVKRFLPVTKNLQQQVSSLIKPVPFTVIPNVVDTGVFNYNEPAQGPFTWLHVSTMVYQKNPEGLLRAFKAFNEIHPGTVLNMVGPYPREVKDYARMLRLGEEVVRFTGAVTYNQVAELLRASNALVLFSRYENLPCVILEALCCGKPVISTRVGGIDEVIDQANGILLESGDVNAMTLAFESMFLQYASYNRKKIAESSVDRFSYQAVGRQMNNVYKEITG